MEEVWNDITLPSLNPNPNPNANFQTLTFQDFLSQPFSNRNPTPAAVASGCGYRSPVSPPPIALTLNPVPDRFNSPRHLDRFRLNPLQPNNVSFDEPASVPRFPELGRKRFPESENSGDRRQKRMIKNRESAARSRARKQAYTNELELEVAHLMEENARLKRQQQQLCLAAASQVPKKHSIHRAATAPF